MDQLQNWNISDLFTASPFPSVVLTWKNNWCKLQEKGFLNNHLGTSEALAQIMTVVLQILPAEDSPVPTTPIPASLLAATGAG